MNKTELIESMAEKSGLTKKQAELALKGFMDTIQVTVANDGEVQIVGFGTFGLRAREERKGTNPRTKEEITIPASLIPYFKPGKTFKEYVNKADKEAEF